MSNVFDPPGEGALIELIRDYPLAWVISAAEGDFAATPLPLLAECDADGRLVSLLGHIPRANPQFAMLDANPRALILFMGPNGYISPSLVSNPSWGPTWNYAAARFTVDLRFVPEETDHALDALAEAVERGYPKPWKPAQMGARYAELRQRIIAFRATIIRSRARFKLGQDEAPATFREIVDGLGDATLARWMKDSGRGDA